MTLKLPTPTMCTYLKSARVTVLVVSLSSAGLLQNVHASDITDNAFDQVPIPAVPASRSASAADGGILTSQSVSSGQVASQPVQTAVSSATNSAATQKTATQTLLRHTFRERLQYMADRASEVAVQAMTAIGIHYKYGGTNPERGLDCSGLVKYVFQEAWGMVLPRTASEMSKEGVKVDRQDLQMGDLIFFNTMRRSFSHVGIYMGDDKFIHAPSTGGQVRIDDMTNAYWTKRYNGARRIEAPELSASLNGGGVPASDVSADGLRRLIEEAKKARQVVNSHGDVSDPAAAGDH